MRDRLLALTQIYFFRTIEQAMLKERVHSTCRGRWLNEDVVDSILTLYVNAGNGPRISDGVDGPIAWSSKVFPYMAPLNRTQAAPNSSIGAGWPPRQ